VGGRGSPKKWRTGEATEVASSGSVPAMTATDGDDRKVMWHQGEVEEVRSTRIDEERAERQCSPREGIGGSGSSKCGEGQRQFGHRRGREAEGESRRDLSASVWREMARKRSSPRSGGVLFCRGR
jgi:hypothetical protein